MWVIKVGNPNHFLNNVFMSYLRFLIAMILSLKNDFFLVPTMFIVCVLAKSYLVTLIPD